MAWILVLPLKTGAKTYKIFVNVSISVGLPEFRFVEAAEPAGVTLVCAGLPQDADRLKGGERTGFALTRDPHQAPMRPSFLLSLSHRLPAANERLLLARRGGPAFRM
jgi:hypothetical protein